MKQALKVFLLSQCMVFIILMTFGCNQYETSSNEMNNSYQERSSYCKYEAKISEGYYFEGIREASHNELLGRVIYDSESTFEGKFKEEEGKIQLVTGSVNHAPYGDKFLTGVIKNLVFKNDVIVTYTDEYRNYYKGTLNLEYNENGTGVLLLKNGTSVEIECDNGEIITAKYSDKDGNIYEGKLNERYLLQGKGTIMYEDGSSYNGYLVDGSPDGYGTIKYKDNDYYTGEFKAGKKEGSGTYNHKDGTVLSGTWNNDKFTLAEEIQYTNGSVYTGSMYNGKKSGLGKIIFKNNDVYEGRWAEDTYNGLGKYTFNSGEYYEGYWVKGKLHGEATYVNKKGVRYIGEWDKGVCKKITKMIE